MNLKPVKHYQPPKYPTQDYLLAHPELLHLVPERWRGNQIVLTALSATIILLTTDSNADPKEIPAIQVPYDTSPIGIVWTPPLIYPRMSEKEACRIIEDEAVHMGIHFKHNAVSFTHVPRAKEYDHGDKDSLVDGFDPHYNVAYEYVSTDDGNIWMIGSNKLQFDSAAFNSKTVIAVFSGEMVWLPEKYKTRDIWGQEQIHSLPKDQTVTYSRTDKRPTEIELRLKVRDFIQWLKSEGII